MNIQLDGVGKRFERNWIFRNISFEINKGSRRVVLGANGSGKSTLLKIIANNVSPSEGRVSYTGNNGEIHPDNVFQHVTIAAPYLEMPEEYSLGELIAFHKAFKPIEKNLSDKDISDLLELSHTKDKMYKHFSSGMKQRVKLGLAILSATPLLLLDEPTTALDAKAIQWYRQMIDNYTTGKTIVVFSNNKEEEFSFCTERFQIVI